MASTYLTYTSGNLPTMTKFTFSLWTKRSQLGANQRILEARVNGTNLSTMYMQSDDKFAVYQEAGGVTKCDIMTDMKMRDVNGWYHICVAVDTTLASGTDRVKIYINGVNQELTRSTQQVQNEEHNYCRSNCATILGTDDNGNGSQFYSGSMGFAIICVGTAYAATDFGEFDSNGVWTIKTSPSVTYGTDGFFILKNGNSVTDQSGEGNNFTVGGGTLTNDKDNPDNVFATMNPLDNYYQGSTFSNGNNTVVSGSTSETYNTSTLMMNSGKFYCEVKPTAGAATSQIGITGQMSSANNENLSSRTYGWAYIDSGSVYNNNSSASGTWGSYANNDIIGIAVDMDNNKLYFSKNGVWQNSGDPTSGSTGTGALSITAPESTTIGAYAFAMNETWNDNTRTWQWNFGNGYFGTTAVSVPPGTNASENGVFEYDVPTGYTALCTKGLNGE